MKLNHIHGVQIPYMVMPIALFFLYQIIQNMQGIYVASTFLNSTFFSLFNPFYCDLNMALPNNQTPKSIPASVIVGPMSPNEQQAFLLVNVIHHNHTDHKYETCNFSSTQAYTSLFISCLYLWFFCSDLYFLLFI